MSGEKISADELVEALRICVAGEPEPLDPEQLRAFVASSGGFGLDAKSLAIGIGIGVEVMRARQERER